MNSGSIQGVEEEDGHICLAEYEEDDADMISR